MFDEARERYNAKQKRKYRMIDNYYEKIRRGKQEKLFHEVIFQIGNKDNMNAKNEDGLLAKRILTEFMDEFQARNPYLYVFSAHLHMDEETPHMHLIFLPVVHTKDKEGNDIYTKYNKNDEPKLYIKKDNNEYEVKQEDETDNYYIEKNKDEKEYLELNSVPLVAKVTMKKNTLITTELLSKGDNKVQNDVRKQEYNMLVLPMDLETGDYIDVRLMLPSGQDYIVVAKKEVEIPNTAGTDSEDTIWLNLSEDEILHMSCAIVDAYKINGAKLYVTKYTEAGMQDAATPTYPANESTTTLLQKDPNILEKAMNEIRNRYNQTSGAELRRDYIKDTIDSQTDQGQANLETKMEESITNSKNSRKEYLESLSGTGTTSE